MNLKNNISFSQIIAAFILILTGFLFGLLFPKNCVIDKTVINHNRKIVLKLGHSLDVSHPVHISMVKMKEYLESYSDSSMTIEINAGGVLGNETQMIEQVRDNSLGMCKTGMASMNSFIPAMGVFNLPYIFNNSNHYWSVLDGKIGQEMLLLGVSLNLRGLCYYDAGSRNFYTKQKPILTPNDLNSIKIRVQNNQIAKDMISLMGASPETIAWGELYTALQQGVVDGAENNIPSYYSSKHYEVCKYFSKNEHTMVPDLLLISQKTWDSLTQVQQKWLQKAANKSSIYQRKLWKEKTESVLQELIKNGVEIYNPEIAPFRELVTPLYDLVKGSDAGDYLIRIKAVK